MGASLNVDYEPQHFLQHIGAAFPLRYLLPRVISNANEELLKLHKRLKDMQDSLNKITVPVMIIHGQQDNLSDFRNVEFIKTHLKNACFIREEILDDGHFIPWRRPEWVLQCLVKFDKECEGLNG